MITILPVKDQEKTVCLLQNIPDAENNAEILSMCDKEEEIATIAIDIKDSTVRMLQIQIGGVALKDILNPADNFMVDSLMRACASYGAAKGTYRIESHIPAIEAVLLSLGFEKNGENLMMDLKNIIYIKNGNS